MFFDGNKKKLLYDTGQWLKSLRQEKGQSLQETGKALSISTTYVSEIERGMKTPSDDLIGKISEYYTIDIDNLFQSFDKVPKLIRKSVTENGVLQKAILQIENKRDLSVTEKEEIYSELYETLQYLLHKKGSTKK